MNTTQKIEVTQLENTTHIYCNVCDPNDHAHNTKLFEIRFHLFSFIQCMVVCDHHADELRQAVFVAQVGLK